MEKLPFMATENVMMEAVKRGGDRQELHEALRTHSHAAAARVKLEGGQNDLIDRIVADPLFPLTREEIEAQMDPALYVGRAPEQVTEIESNRGDRNWWQVYGEGQIGTLEGLVYSFELVDAMPPRNTGKPQSEKTEAELYADSLEEVQGLDFGFTNDPTARVQIYADMRADGVDGMTEIYADCAEPKSIAEIQDEGFNVMACDKDAPVKSDKLKFQLLWMQGWTLYVTRDSLDLIRELRNYTWAKDRDGNMLNYPIGEYNHALDAMRYALWTKYAQNYGFGEYCLSSR